MTKVLLSQEKSNPAKNLAKVFFSLLILSVISIQLYSAILIAACKIIKIPLCYLPDEPGLYPFLDYPMYSTVRNQESVVEQHQIVAIFADGTEKTLKAEDFGLSQYWFLGQVVPAFERQKLSSVAVHTAAYERQGNQPFVAFRVDSLPMRVSENGVHVGKVVTGERISITAGVQ